MLASLAIGLSGYVLWRYVTRGQSIGVRTALVALRPRARDLLAVAFYAATGGLFLVLLTAGLGFLLLPLLFGPPLVVHVIALEDKRVSEAWSATKELARGHTVRILVYLLTIALGVTLLGSLIINVYTTFSEGLASVPRTIIFLVMQAVVTGVTFPYLAAASFSCYWDLRVRKDQPSET